jgi:dTDP-glucose 4,6-dehydratase
MTISEFANTIRDLTGTKSSVVYKPLPEDDPKQRQPDITKARKLLGWSPVVGLEEGMRRTVEYFQSVHARDLTAA